MGKRNKGGARKSKVRAGQGWELVAARSAEARQAPARLTSEPASAQKITIRLERRKDKQVTVARGFRLSPNDLKTLGKTIKSRCSAGGKVGEDHVEVQGDHRERVAELLGAQGYQVKL